MQNIKVNPKWNIGIKKINIIKHEPINSLFKFINIDSKI
jgi:hypothetical protein